MLCFCQTLISLFFFFVCCYRLQTYRLSKFYFAKHQTYVCPAGSLFWLASWLNCVLVYKMPDVLFFDSLYFDLPDIRLYMYFRLICQTQDSLYVGWFVLGQTLHNLFYQTLDCVLLISTGAHYRTNHTCLLLKLVLINLCLASHAVLYTCTHRYICVTRTPEE